MINLAKSSKLTLSSPLYTSPTSRYSICYSSWIKPSGEPSGHLFNMTKLNNYCTDHYTNCPEFKDVHPLYVGVSIYNETLKNP